ncbi:MAG: YHS domain-containing protein [Thermodesulfobacteriota bacterium]
MTTKEQMVRDPVCGIDVDTSKPARATRFQGRQYYFCSPHCQDEFRKAPDKFAVQPKGFIGRFLDRLARSNEKEYGSHGPSCCH